MFTLSNVANLKGVLLLFGFAKRSNIWNVFNPVGIPCSAKSMLSVSNEGQRLTSRNQERASSMEDMARFMNPYIHCAFNNVENLSVSMSFK